MLRSTPNPTPENHRWYDEDGVPVVGIPNKSKPGELRKPTVADARKHRYRKSVTSIIRAMSAPQLETWKIDQAILAAITGPHVAKYESGELSDRALIDAVRADAEQIAAEAAARGTEIHGAYESLLRNEQVPEELEPWTRAIYASIANTIGPPNKFMPEVLITHDEPRYGGRCDQASEYLGFVLDLKGKESIAKVKSAARDFVKQSMFPEVKMQIAAYCQALGIPNGAVVYFSRTEAYAETVIMPARQFEHYTKCFNSLCVFSNTRDGLVDLAEPDQASLDLAS